MIRRLIITLAVAQFLFFPLVPGFCQDTKEDAESYYKLGQAYYEQGRYKEAEDLFAKSLDILSREKESKSAVVQPTPGAEGNAGVNPVVQEPVPAFTQSPSAVSIAHVTPAPAVRARQEYIIGEEDSLGISVWQNPDLDSEVIVRPDGMISCPLIGDLQAAGLTIAQLKDVISSRLSEYVKNPQVSLAIKKIGGKRVVLLGQVSSPGVYSVAGAKSVMEAIAMAGGFTRDAVPSSTVIIRGGFSGPKAQKLNLSKVFAGDLKDNIALQSEDIIFVPRKFISDVNYFLEQVLDPLSRGVYVSKELQTY